MLDNKDSIGTHQLAIKDSQLAIEQLSDDIDTAFEAVSELH